MLQLGKKKIDSILLEGGGTLNQSAFASGIVSHVQAYLAPKIFGGSGKYTPVSGIGVREPDKAYFLTNRRMKEFGEDILLEYDVVKTPEKNRKEGDGKEGAGSSCLREL